jgi:hypothetical protein
MDRFSGGSITVPMGGALQQHVRRSDRLVGLRNADHAHERQHLHRHPSESDPDDYLNGVAFLNNLPKMTTSTTGGTSDNHVYSSAYLGSVNHQALSGRRQRSGLTLSPTAIKLRSIGSGNIPRKATTLSRDRHISSTNGNAAIAYEQLAPVFIGRSQPGLYAGAGTLIAFSANGVADWAGQSKRCHNDKACFAIEEANALQVAAQKAQAFRATSAQTVDRPAPFSPWANTFAHDMEFITTVRSPLATGLHRASGGTSYGSALKGTPSAGRR